MAIKNIVLFGSKADGKNVHKDSDTDLACIVSNESDKQMFATHLQMKFPDAKIELFPEYTGGNQSNIHFLIMDEAEFEDDTHPLTASVRKGVTLF